MDEGLTSGVESPGAGPKKVEDVYHRKKKRSKVYHRESTYSNPKLNLARIGEVTMFCLSYKKSRVEPDPNTLSLQEENRTGGQNLSFARSAEEYVQRL